MTPRALWLVLPMADTEVRAYIAAPDDPDLRIDGDPHPAEGMCLRQEGVILINADVPQRRRLGVLVHEAGHMAIFLSGAQSAARINDAREEILVGSAFPLLTQGLMGAGLLRGRRVPR